MPDPRPAITPETRVGELLAAYPALEDVLVSLAPAFANLRNPLLRRTVARVATLEQAARIGGLTVRELVLRLREAAGVADLAPGERASTDADVRNSTTSDSAHPDARETSGPGIATQATAELPAWVSDSRVVAVLDADALLDRGEHPLGVVKRLLGTLDGSEAICIESSFLPAPLIDALREQRCEVASVPDADRYRTWVRKV
jgi:hypothetical protein